MTNQTVDPSLRAAERGPRQPPRWLMGIVWRLHRAMYRFTGRGLSLPRPDRIGMLRLRTVGRRSGRERAVILGYYEDGPNFILAAMNAGSAREPAWWLNLQARPDASVDLKDGTRAVRARAASGAERQRLWDELRVRTRGRGADLDAYARLRPTETAVVVLEPRAETPGRTG